MAGKSWSTLFFWRDPEELQDREEAEAAEYTAPKAAAGDDWQAPAGNESWADAGGADASWDAPAAGGAAAADDWSAPAAEGAAAGQNW
mmetsp:Transcript_17319/g.43619  ORF Transcript_17319/g.43619 Transcript_17319/m.43619 type:complete len:88 (+) Transcript_17319:36-299(+)